MNTCSSKAASQVDDHHEYAMQLLSSSILPMALKTATELGVLEIIEKAGTGALLSSSQIASQIPNINNKDAPSVLDRILSLLASHSILTCSTAVNSHNRLYGLAPVAKYFIRNQDGGSLTPFLAMLQDKVMINMWYRLKDVVFEEGNLFEKTYGVNAMEYMGKDSRFCEIFKASMREFNPLFIQRILEIYDGFQGLKSVVDVGGGDGSLLNLIVSKYPSIKGINYDLRSVIESSPSYPGIEHVAGDMFVSIPKGEAIFMKWILHGWDDEDCLKLLKNCYEALPSNGKVIAVDMVVPGTPGSNAAARSLQQLYLYLASINRKGKERTEEEFQSLAKKSGFSHVRVARCAYNFSVVELLKNM